MNPSEYKEVFLAEARENLANLNRSLLVLEKNPAENESIKEIFRAAHTLKGMSATMGYEPMARLTHEMESALDPIRLGRRPLTSSLVDTLFACLDQLETWVKELGSSDRLDNAPLASLLSRLQSSGSAAIETALVTPTPPPTPGRNEPVTAPPPLLLSEGEREVLSQARSGGFSAFQVTVEFHPDCAFKEVRAFMVLRNINENGEVLRSDPSPEDIEAGRFGKGFRLVVVTDKTASDLESSLRGISEVTLAEVVPYQAPAMDSSKVISPRLVEPPSAVPPVPSSAPTKDERLRVAPTVRVHTSKLDRLMALVQELVIAKIRFEQTAIATQSEELQEPLTQLHYISSELQNVITEVRLVPVQVIFERFPRMVRDLSKSLGKEVELVLEGGGIELDRTIVDEMSEPLVHLLRNAVDHGIEAPEEREKKGKPRVGVLRLTAKRDRSHVLVTLSDDGRGIDPALIREKAIQKGMLRAEEADRLTDEEALRFISTPGFSTRVETTSVSGRGVGVDVAKTRVESLGGSFRIQSERGHGSTFLIRFPLTLAIVKALLVKVADEIFAVPVSYVVETVDVGPESRRLVQQQETLLLREEVIPLYHLRELLELPPPPKVEAGAEIPVIIAEVSDSRVALQVDEILGQSEIALKSLDRFMKGVKGYAGVTILGDGRIALILDLLALLEDLRRHRYQSSPAAVS
jgi:two-component system chemotaxis sensor kinase CheA